jgi:hypothetical protein
LAFEKAAEKAGALVLKWVTERGAARALELV